MAKEVKERISWKTEYGYKYEDICGLLDISPGSYKTIMYLHETDKLHKSLHAIAEKIEKYNS